MARVAVIIPCFNDGSFVREVLGSLREEEELEVVLVDDSSTDPETDRVLEEVEAEGVRVLRNETNRGPGACRNRGVAESSAPYIFPLDCDDLAEPGVLARLADLLDADDAAAVAYGDYREFGEVDIVRAVPETIDAYRLAYTNEYPPMALFRRTALAQVNGWDEYREGDVYYEDWDLWLRLAGAGLHGVYAGHGVITYHQRVHGVRLLERTRRKHTTIYERIRRQHPGIFGELRQFRRSSDLSRSRKLLYPVVYGGRKRHPAEAKVKGLLDRAGVWTLRG